MPSGKGCVLRNKHKSDIGKSSTAMKSPLVVLKKIPLKAEQASYVTEEVVISDIPNSLDNNELTCTNDGNLKSLNLRNKSSISYKQIHKKIKTRSNLGIKNKITKQKSLSNMVQNVKFLSTPIVLLEKLSTDMKPNSFIKEKVLDAFDCSGIEIPKQTGLNKKFKKIKKKIKNFMQTHKKAEVQSISDAQINVKDEFSIKEVESVQNKEIITEQELKHKSLKNQHTESELLNNSIPKAQIILKDQCSIEEAESIQSKRIITEQELEHKSLENQHTEPKLLNNSIPHAQIIVEDKCIAETELIKNKRILTEEELQLHSDNSENLKNENESIVDKKTISNKHIVTEENSSDQLINTQQMYFEPEFLINSITFEQITVIDECPTEKELIKEAQQSTEQRLEDEQMITEVESLINLDPNEKDHIDECFIEEKLVENYEIIEQNCSDPSVLDKAACCDNEGMDNTYANNVTVESSGDLTDDKAIDYNTDDQQPINENCSINQVKAHESEDNIISNNYDNDGDDGDDDDEEIIIYYINSANEVIKRIDKGVEIKRELTILEDICTVQEISAEKEVDIPADNIMTVDTVNTTEESKNDITSSEPTQNQIESDMLTDNIMAVETVNTSEETKNEITSSEPSQNQIESDILIDNIITVETVNTTDETKNEITSSEPSQNQIESVILTDDIITVETVNTTEETKTEITSSEPLQNQIESVILTDNIMTVEIVNTSDETKNEITSSEPSQNQIESVILTDNIMTVETVNTSDETKNEITSSEPSQNQIESVILTDNIMTVETVNTSEETKNEITSSEPTQNQIESDILTDNEERNLNDSIINEKVLSDEIKIEESKDNNTNKITEAIIQETNSSDKEIKGANENTAANKSVCDEMEFVGVKAEEEVDIPADNIMTMETVNTTEETKNEITSSELTPNQMESNVLTDNIMSLETINTTEETKNEITSSEPAQNQIDSDILTDPEDISDDSSTEEYSSDGVYVDESNDNFVDTNQCSEQSTPGSNSVDESTNDATNVSTNTSKDIFISLMDAYQKISSDINDVNAPYAFNEESNGVNNSGRIPEVLIISDDSDNDVVILENDDLSVDQRQTDEFEHDRTLTLLKRKLQFADGKTVISASKLYGTDDGQLTLDNLKDVPLTCSRCGRVYIGKKRMQKHWYMCKLAAVLKCKFCPQILKYKRTLQRHLRNVHGIVNEKDIRRIVNQVLGKPDDDTVVPPEKKPEPKRIPIPSFVKLHCRNCGQHYVDLPPSYKQNCEHCSVPLSIYCQRCERHYATTPRIQIHLLGNCPSQRRENFQCPHCDYSSPHKNNVVEHALRRHARIEPEDYPICRNGNCGSSFKTLDARSKHEKHCGKEANLCCKFCKYRTKHRSAIKMHMQQHVLRNETVVPADEELEVAESEPAPKFINAKTPQKLDEKLIRSKILARCTKCDKMVKLPKKAGSVCDTCFTPITYGCRDCVNFMQNDNFSVMRMHVLRCHTEKIYGCPNCRRRYAYWHDYKYHISGCGKQMNLHCKQCKFRTNSARGMRLHLKRMHAQGSDGPNFCAKCSKPFGSRETLQRHRKIFCDAEARLLCAHCHFRTRSKFSLTRHIQNRHSSLFASCCQFKCSSCGKDYSNLYAYDTHVEQCAVQRARDRVYVTAGSQVSYAW